MSVAGVGVVAGGVGVVAALASEAHALGPSMPRGGTPIPVYELAQLGDGALLVVSGIGRAAATAAADVLVAAGASSLMTFGMAGALDPALQPGIVVLPRELLSDGRRFQAEPAWRERVAAELRPLRAVSEGNLLTCDQAIDTPARKAAAFHGTGAVAVDMESAAVAEVAARHHMPFIAVRVIVDTAADTLPRAVVAASRAGSVKIARLIAGLAIAPGEIAALLRLAQRYRAAIRTLRAVGQHLS